MGILDGIFGKSDAQIAAEKEQQEAEERQRLSTQAEMAERARLQAYRVAKHDALAKGMRGKGLRDERKENAVTARIAELKSHKREPVDKTDKRAEYLATFTTPNAHKSALGPETANGSLNRSAASKITTNPSAAAIRASMSGEPAIKVRPQTNGVKGGGAHKDEDALQAGTTDTVAVARNAERVGKTAQPKFAFWQGGEKPEQKPVQQRDVEAIFADDAKPTMKM